VVVELQEDLPPAPLDYVQIDQVLTNLIDNSVKYSPEETEIKISARVVAGEVQVEVGNHSPTIPGEALPHLFEPFYQVEPERRRTQGTGLGLAVARGLVDVHGGRIWATSGPLVTSFVFSLPLGPEGAATPEEQQRG